jgi:DNA invertase Pin-like site-specific DNA recombinase
MNRIFGYVRVSGKAQAEKDGPVRQRLAISEFAQAHFPGGVPQVFEDLGVSGTKEGVDRPGFMDMLVAAAPGDVIVVEAMDRLARDLVVQELIIKTLREQGLKLYSTDQGFKDQVTGGAEDDPSRVMIRQIFGVIAQFAKSSLVLKLRMARQRKRQETGRCEGRPAYGATKGEMVLLNLVQNLKDSGVGAGGIAALLNEQGVKKRQGTRPWCKSEVQTLIKRINKRRKSNELSPNMYPGQPPIVGS